ncbi:hypothetical protein [Xylanibacter muris]|uniref:PA14 domain-containing protein n=1 Tax=Xylanibacter muris TaxID=2736290 RepID=A0ABX2AP61_9BACT|nr:hypothetical protein [Xylanibacter muris]NPD92974.1 hypothetical protein [Xylanibacter muris]
MKKNLLLSLGMFFSASFAWAQAPQVMFEGFDSEQTKGETEVGWYEFINNQDGDERTIEDGAMHFYNTLIDASNWQRAIKFRNLPIKEQTSYRVSFDLCGTNEYTIDGETMKKGTARVALMQGQENGDLAFLGKNDEMYTYDISYFQEKDDKGFRKYTMMFYYANNAVQQEYYAKHPGELTELAQKFFLTLNMYTPGDYYIDNVLVEESEIAGVRFIDDKIQVSFGYDTNIKDLVKANDGRVILPNDCITLSINDEIVDVLSVELLDDGFLYIFCGDVYPSGEDDKVVVSFRNPEGANQIQYKGNKHPRVFEGDVVVRAFNNEVGRYDYEGDIPDVFSYAYETPKLAKAVPENGAFNLPNNISEFALTFNKDADCSQIEATLTGDNGSSEKLAATPAEGLSKEVVFKRAATGDLPTGEYTLHVTKIFPERMLGEDIFGEETITMYIGQVEADPNDTARVVYKDNFKEKGANYIPEGWEVCNDGTVAATGGAGSGPRIFNFNGGGDFDFALYVRTGNNANGEAEDQGYAQYGQTEEYLITLDEGDKYQLSFNAAAWKGTPWVRCYVIAPNGEIVIQSINECLPNLNGNTGSSTMKSTKVSMEFKAPETGNYKIKWVPCAKEDGSSAAWLEIMIANIRLDYVPASPASRYDGMLKNAVDAAKVCRDNNSGERYLGEAWTALDELIKKYDGQRFTAPSAYEIAVAELQEAVNTLNKHVSLINTYDGLISGDNSAQALVDKYAESKFNGTDYYLNLVEANNKYTGRLLTDDAELETAIAELTKVINICKNMFTEANVNDKGIGSQTGTTGVAALTERIRTGIAVAKKLGAAEDNETLVEAAKVITDDDDVANAVKKVVKTELYGKLKNADNGLFDTKVDDVTLEEYTDSFDMTVFVKNPNLYLINDNKLDANHRVTDGDDVTVPGWRISVGEGYEVTVSTGWSWTLGEDNPYVDGMIQNWARGFRAEQTITDLPAGIYTIMGGFGEREASAEAEDSYFFIKTSADEEDQKVKTPVIGQTFPYSNLAFTNVVITDGKLTLGAVASGGSHVFFNNIQLFMKNSAEGFDYAAAYEEILDGIDGVGANNAEVRKVELYDLNGRRIITANKGINIVKKYMSDGSVRTEKVIVK